MDTLHINPPVTTELIGGTVQYSVTADLSTGDTISATNEVTYTSSDEAIAVINEGGLATATGEGEATITASYTLNGVTSTATATLTVKPASITLVSISVSPSSIEKPIGTTGTFKATAIYSDGTSYDVTRETTWVSNENDIVTIETLGENAGDAHTLSAGSATITASYNSKTDTSSVTVIDAVLQSILITPADTSTVVGINTEYRALGSYSGYDAFVDITKDVTWSSTDITVATMDDFIARTIGAGETTITASLFSITGTASLTVTAATLESIQILDADTNTAIEDGEKFVVKTTRQAKAMGTYSNGLTADISDAVIWSTFTPEIVSVSVTGLITSLKAGDAHVLCEYRQSGSALISDTVEGVVYGPTIKGLTITGDNESVVSLTIPLEVIAEYENNAITVTNVATWSSDNVNILVDSQGKVTASEAGKAIISATFDGKTDTHEVTFVEATVSHLEIQENGGTSCQGTSVNDITKTIAIVDEISYPTDPDGLSPNAFYPIVCVVYTDGRKEYVNEDALWYSDDQSSAYIDYLKGSFVFGIDVSPKVEITASFAGESAKFFVDVVNP